MSAIDDALRANAEYARTYSGGGLTARPAKKLAVVCCKDARIVVEQVLGLSPGDAHIIRNGGGIVTPDVIRSLLISHYKLGATEVMIINHTGCGLLTFRGDDLMAELRESTGLAMASPESFHTFNDLETNVREQVSKVQSHPWLAGSLVVRGFVLDIQTGLLREVL